MKKDKFKIQGLGADKFLSGKIKVNGAKNAILPVLASAVLFEDSFLAKNVPDIEDLNRLKEIFNNLGISMEEKSKGEYFINSEKINSYEIEKEAAKKMRASIIFSGPILARFGKLVFPHPGGCVIGARPIDIFLESFQKMGAKIEHRDEKYFIEAPNGKLKGADIFLKIPSVTATETLIMAGVLAEGKTVLKNVAMEPEITSLIEWLNQCGAKIKGANSSVLEIEGTGLLQGKNQSYQTIPDRLEAGSFLILGALCASDLEIYNCNPEHLEIVIELLKDAGVNLETNQNSIRVNCKNRKNYKAFNIKTHEYPGFPTDLQSPMTVFLTQAQGESLVFETIFEGRLNYIEDLVNMGADIRMWDSHRVMVKGPKKLKGKELEGPDIRTGFAFVIASLIAEKESIIDNVYYIDRGYENIERRLSAIGAEIERIKN